MTNKKYEWLDPKPVESIKILEISEKFKLNQTVAKILLERGLTNDDEISSFLEPSQKDFNDLSLLYDIEKAVDRIMEAVYEKQKIVIYGDYDADGLTSTSIMYQALKMVEDDVNVSYYIPNRFKDGYGPNKIVYQKLISEGAELIITVDNGVSGFEAIEYARKQGVDVVVTDHHELPLKLPNAYAIVHPRHPLGNYPFKDLCGAGVAFKVACAILEESPKEMLDLVAIGTVADLVPLKGENRALVKYGLEQLKKTKRKGLLALLNQARISLTQIDSEKIGFGIAPRLNSLGRLGDANVGVELLTTNSEEVAFKLAKLSNEENVKRQTLVKNITKEAINLLDDTSAVNVIYKEGFHEGVLGIVASHIVEKTNKPTIVLTKHDNLLKGSGRSVDGFNLFKALDPNRDILSSFGGHYMACGLSLEMDNLDKLRAVLNSEASKQHFTLKKPKIEISSILSIDEVTQDLIESLKKLEPFGNENEKPIFRFKDYTIKDIRTLGKEHNHLKITLKDSENILEAVWFGVDREVRESILANPTQISLIGSLGVNYFNDQVSLQIMVKDISYKESLLCYDLRAGTLNMDKLKHKGAFIFFNPKSAEKLGPHLKDKKVIQYNIKTTEDAITFVDLPDELEQINECLENIQPKRIYFIFATSKKFEPILPSKKQFQALYKFLVKYQKVNLKEKFEKFANYLKISTDLLNVMLKVFLEVGFVKIDSGVLTLNKAQDKKVLELSKAYQQRKKKIEAYVFLRNSSSGELSSWFMQHFKEEKD